MTLEKVPKWATCMRIRVHLNRIESCLETKTDTNIKKTIKRTQNGGDVEAAFMPAEYLRHHSYHGTFRFWDPKFFHLKLNCYQLLVYADS